MDDYQLRLECLKMAIPLCTVEPHKILAAAKELYGWVKEKEILKEKMMNREHESQLRP